MKRKRDKYTVQELQTAIDTYKKEEITNKKITTRGFIQKFNKTIFGEIPIRTFSHYIKKGVRATATMLSERAKNIAARSRGDTPTKSQKRRRHTGKKWLNNLKKLQNIREKTNKRPTPKYRAITTTPEIGCEDLQLKEVLFAKWGIRKEMEEKNAEFEGVINGPGIIQLSNDPFATEGDIANTILTVMDEQLWNSKTNKPVHGPEPHYIGCYDEVNITLHDPVPKNEVVLPNDDGEVQADDRDVSWTAAFCTTGSGVLWNLL
eukprot:GCRY01005805.1.p1 GENE.GCRY01005805.1~~GCRY01005805.1.p1  ORF type:complete len:262 (-),score=19.65 GCRY01005805.1:1598-2383(-)